MTEFRYKAFISYSHRDEAWATWLHKALESYRLPRKLAKAQGASGAAPGRLYPVFRDREEFSSSTDLSERVQEALRDSAAMVVICSPAAAASRWVNEEIRTFRSLGRSDRIHCMIVDGEPDAGGAGENCFPPALMEGVAEHHEPLAADVRKWADGKLLGKLKLVSGLLGVRLDELRQREQKRQRLRKLGYALAGIVIAGLVVTAVVSRLSEQARRTHAEELVTQIVDISSDLGKVADLQTLRTIGQRLQNYLDTLEKNDLTPESRKQVALVLRQLGEVSRLQGETDDSLAALQDSRSIFQGLAEDFPGNTDYLFELGNAEFYVANALMGRGELEEAGASFERYAALANSLHEQEPDNPAWMMEMSYSHTNLAGFQNISGAGTIETALAHISSAIEQSESALTLDPSNAGYHAHYSTILAWAADTYLRVCDLDSALEARLKGGAEASENLAAQPGDNILRKQQAYAQTGIAALQRMLGRTAEARQNLVEARDMLRDLQRFDDQNLEYRWGALRLDALLFDLAAETGNLQDAADIASGLERPMRETLNSGQSKQPAWRSQYARYLLDHASLLWRLDEPRPARERLEQALSVLSDVLSSGDRDMASLARLERARFLWWENEGGDVFDSRPGLILMLEQAASGTRSCSGAVAAAEAAIMAGDLPVAQGHVDYLRERSFAEPGFIRLCSRYELCEPAAGEQAAE